MNVLYDVFLLEQNGCEMDTNILSRNYERIDQVKQIAIELWQNKPSFLTISNAVIHLVVPFSFFVGRLSRWER